MLWRSISGIFVAIAASGCTRGEATLPVHSELGSRHVTPAVTARRAAVPADQGRIHFHMNQRLDDLREVGNLLVAGKLAEAQALSFMLSRPVEEPALPSWSEDSARISAAASSFAGATSLAEACSLLPRIAAVCADCHDRLQAQTDVRPLEHARCHPPTE